MKDPSQALYDELFKTSLALGFKTFNYLPDAKTPYPFVYFGEQIDVPTETKFPNVLIGSTTLTCHIYGERKNRKLITDMAEKLILHAKYIKTADVYSIDFSNVKKQMIQDNSTATVLWHAIVDLEFNYSNY